MGKIRVKTLGDEGLEKEEKKQAKVKKTEKIARAAAESGEEKIEVEAEKEVKIEAQAQPSDNKELAEEKKEAKKPTKKSQKAFRSQKYDELKTQVDKTKAYSLAEALVLLNKLQRGKFDETVELHLNTLTSGIAGNVTLPNGTGKKTKVAIADDVIIAEIEKGVINFDILVATPDMMPKLAKVARVLGPRGLMPNPKNGTITEKPEEVAKKYEAGQISFKTENKNSLLHLTVGKISFGADKLTENIETIITAVKQANIVNATIKSTMSPGIKLKV